MKRDLRNYIKEYEEKFSESSRGHFYTSDIAQIKAMSRRTKGCSLFLDTILNSLKAGFMIGYKCGVRERQKKNSEKA